MGNFELFQEWIKYADEDQQIAEVALQAKGPANQICFHCQQLGEKYLKGFLAFHNSRFEKRHQLDYLLALCQELEPGFSDLTEPVKFLTDFYIETRYSGDIPDFSLTDARKAYEAAKIVKEFVLGKLSI